MADSPHRNLITHHGRRLIWLALAALPVLAGVSYFLLSSRAAPTPRDIVAIEIGSNRLLVPARLIRDPEKRLDGKTARLDLSVLWPSFEAERPKTAESATQPIKVRSDAAPPPASPSPGESGHRLFIGLEAADAALDPARRPSELYARFLGADVGAGPAGLIMRSFKNASPYAGETLFIAAPNGAAFSARCILGETVESPDSRCLWLYRADGLDVQVRFSEALLDDWQDLGDRTRALVEKLRN
jgi:hypothetical protein